MEFQRQRRRALLLLAATLALPALAADRSHKTRKAFMLENPCPSTGKTSGPCPGFVADHLIPICAGGRDEPWNLQWQTVEDAKAKDVIERRECAGRASAERQAAPASLRSPFPNSAVREHPERTR